jgi:lantibiotic biosynthesis protein
MQLTKLFHHTGFVVLRTPLLPFSELDDWVADVAYASGNAQWDHEQSRMALVQRLRNIFRRPELKEALLFAAPGIEPDVDAWLANSGSAPKLERTLVRYFTRLSSRETPFGIFAGVSVGTVGDSTRLELGARSTYRRHTRLGMGYLVRLLNRLAERPTLQDCLRYEVNSTLHEAFGRLRFARLDLDRDVHEAESYPVVDIEPTPHLARALERAARGATLDEIATSVREPGVDEAEALEFARALAKHGVLVPTWLPSVSGPEPFEGVRLSLGAFPELKAEANLLGSASQRLVAVDASPIGMANDALRSLHEELTPGGSPRERARLLQTDLMKPAPRLSLASAHINLLLRAAELVQQTSVPEEIVNLDAFRERFLARYQAQRVPLVEALDADLGLGFDAFDAPVRDAWVDDIVTRGDSVTPHAATALDHVRIELLTRALQQGNGFIELDRELLDLFPKRRLEPLPESFAVAARVSMSGGRMQVIAPQVIAPSAVATFSRFCHADPQLERAVRAHVALEQAQAGERVLADVAHLPNGHVANILLRPVLRSYEVIWAGKSGAVSERQIPISDLFLAVEKGGRFALYSKRLDKEISIRITNAHNVGAHSNLSLYRFLGALQQSECGAIAAAWSWGSLRSSPFLPRIASGDIVLSRARWTLGKKVVEQLSRSRSGAAFARVQTERERIGLPRWVSVLASEGPLVIDLDNCLSVELLLHEIRSDERATLEEVMPTPERLAVKGPEGLFVGEVVVPCVRGSDTLTRAKRSMRGSTGPSPATPIDRSFWPGSEWLYVKIFMNPSQFEPVLQHIAKVLLSSNFGITRWFYVPYADPEPHLRLRLRGDASALMSRVLPALRDALTPWKARGVVWRLELDTYDREIERYGGPLGIGLAEEIFHKDSQASLEIGDLCSDESELRWQFTLVGIDRLLGDLGFNLEQRSAFVTDAFDWHQREFDDGFQLRHAIGSRYRQYASSLRDLLWSPAPAARPIVARGLAILDQRSERIAGACQCLQLAIERGELSVDRVAIAASLTHMHAVRLLGLKVRAYERILYDYLRRQYATRLALGIESKGR